MEITTISFWGKSRYWWAVLLVGILLIPCGIWLVARPDIGYSVISLLLGWFLIILGILQLIIASDINRREQGWGWWLAGGILDILIGFLLVSNLVLSEIVLPYFFAFILLYRAIKNIVAGVMLAKAYKGWWLYLLNGILLLIVSIFFFFAPLMATIAIVYVCAFVFIYWGMTLITFAADLKPYKREKYADYSPKKTKNAGFLRRFSFLFTILRQIFTLYHLSLFLIY